MKHIFIWATALLLTCALCIPCTVRADGAPTSQFGFHGWPYRQQSACPGASQECADCTETPDCSPQEQCTPVYSTAQPPSTPSPEISGNSTPEPSWDPAVFYTAIPSEPPVTPPEATAQPKPTADPAVFFTAIPKNTPTARPTCAPAATPLPPTAAPTERSTAQPTIVPAQSPTKKPTAQPTIVPAQSPTKKPTAQPTIAPPADTGHYTTDYVLAQEQKALNLLNQDRAANGLPALTLDPELSRLARIKSCDMNTNGYFAHESPTYGNAASMLTQFGYEYNGVGENIAHHATVDKAEAAFLSSQGHRINMMGKQWTKVGIGVCIDENGFVYLTQIFVR